MYTDLQEIKYRPIDINNPFINDSWEKGENWVNSQYDYTGIIDKDIWNKRALYNINLSKDDISAIKKSNYNNRGYNPYLGLCDKQDDKLKDSITKNVICKYIK